MDIMSIVAAKDLLQKPAYTYPEASEISVEDFHCQVQGLKTQAKTTIRIKIKNVSGSIVPTN